MTITISSVRTIDGIELPVAGVWNIDTAHAEVGFVARHFVVSKVRGRLPVAEGRVVIADDPSASSLEVTLNVAGLESGNADRDAHLRSADFFDVDNFPTASFRSTSVDWSGGNGTVTGDLTIKDVTRPVTLEVEFSGNVADPWGGHRAAFSASTTVNREDWGLTWNAALETGGVVVSKEVRLEIEVETVHEG